MFLNVYNPMFNPNGILNSSSPKTVQGEFNKSSVCMRLERIIQFIRVEQAKSNRCISDTPTLLYLAASLYQTPMKKGMRERDRESELGCQHTKAVIFDTTRFLKLAQERFGATCPVQTERVHIYVLSCYLLREKRKEKILGEPYFRLTPAMQSSEVVDENKVRTRCEAKIQETQQHKRIHMNTPQTVR